MILTITFEMEIYFISLEMSHLLLTGVVLNILLCSADFTRVDAV